MNRPIRPAIAIVAALLFIGRAPADTYTWTVTGGGNWDNGANWTPSTAYPGAADLASFASTSPSGTVTVVGDQPVYGIEYQAGTPGRTISGGTLRLGAGGIVMNDDPAGNETISSNITLTAPVLVNNLSAYSNEKRLYLNGTIDTAGFALAVASANRTEINGRITGAGGVSLTKSSTHLRSGSNDFTGDLSVASGTAYVNGGGVITGTPVVRLNQGGILVVGDTGTGVGDDGVTTFGRLGNDALMNLNAARFNFVGQNGAATAETMGVLSLDNGRSLIAVTSGSGGTATLTVATLFRNPETRALGIVTSDNYSLGSSSFLKLADGGATLTHLGGTDSRGTDKAIAVGLTSGTTATRSGNWGNTFVRYDAAAGFVPLDPAADYVNATAMAFPAVNPDGNDNVRLPWTAVHPTNAASSVTLGGDTTVNSLVFFNDNASYDDKMFTLDGAAGTKLTVKSGHLLAACTAASARYYVTLSSNLTLDLGEVEGIVWAGDAHYGGITLNAAITGSNGLTLTTRSQSTEGDTTLGGDNRGLHGAIRILGGEGNNGVLILNHRYGLGDGTNELYLGRGVVWLNTAISGGIAPTAGAVSGSGTIRGDWNMASLLNIGGDGTGGAERTVNLLASGRIAPGTASQAGTIALGENSNSNGSTVAFKAGTVAIDLFSATTYDSLSLSNGTRPLTVTYSGGGHPGSRLSLNLGYIPGAGEAFRIMSIAGTTTTTGALDTPDSGTTVYGAQGGWLHKFDVLYNSSLGGGDGNDLVLQRSADTTAYPYEWGIDASGAWSAADAALENWRHYVQPDGADAHVLFGSAVTAPQTVTLDAPKTAGHLVFDNANAYLLDGAAANALTLATTAGDATVTVSSGAHTIAAPVALANDLSVDIANAADSLTMTGDLSGAAGGLTKTGPGTLTLDGDNTYPGATTVGGGRLSVNGTHTGGGPYTVLAGTSLGGIGAIGSVIGGAGTVDPGDSPGLLTAVQTDPTDGLDYNFEFTMKNGEPNWAEVENDVFRLTHATTPFMSALDGDNTISLYLEATLFASLLDGDELYGGFYTDAGDPLADLADALLDVYYEDAGGSVIYNGVTYSPLTDPLASFTLGTVENGQFAQRGFLTVFSYSGAPIPEPASGLLLLACGALAMRRRHR